MRINGQGSCKVLLDYCCGFEGVSASVPLQCRSGLHERMPSCVGVRPAIQGKRNVWSIAPTSLRDGVLSPGLRRLANAAHCCFFCESFRNSSVNAKGTSLGITVPRLSNEASIALLRDAMS